MRHLAVGFLNKKLDTLGGRMWGLPNTSETENIKLLTTQHTKRELGFKKLKTQNHYRDRDTQTGAFGMNKKSGERLPSDNIYAEHI